MKENDQIEHSMQRRYYHSHHHSEMCMSLVVVGMPLAMQFRRLCLRLEVRFTSEKQPDSLPRRPMRKTASSIVVLNVPLAVPQTNDLIGRFGEAKQGRATVLALAVPG